MKKRLFVLAGLAISFALPIYAQEKSAVDPEIRQEIEAVGMQFVEAYNKHDPAAVAALYTQDAVCLEDWEGGGLLVGREALEKGFAAGFAVSFPPVVGKLDQMYAIEDRIAAISEYSVGSYHGHKVRIYARDANTWKIRMEFVTEAQLPQSLASQPAATPSDAAVNAVCPVSGNRIVGFIGKPLYAQYQGKNIAVCCNECLTKFQNNPDKYGPLALKNDSANEPMKRPDQ